MKRFFDNDPDNNPEQFRFDDDYFNHEFDGEYDEDSESIAYIDTNGLIDMLQLDIAQAELDQKLLQKAIEVASSSLFWKWKSVEKKSQAIDHAYAELAKIMDSLDDPERYKEGENDADL